MSFLALSILAVAFAGLHFSEGNYEHIETEFFEVGMSAIAVYTAPGDTYVKCVFNW